MPSQISQHHDHLLPAMPKFTEQGYTVKKMTSVSRCIFVYIIPTSRLNMRLQNALEL